MQLGERRGAIPHDRRRKGDVTCFRRGHPFSLVLGTTFGRLSALIAACKCEFCAFMAQLRTKLTRRDVRRMGHLWINCDVVDRLLNAERQGIVYWRLRAGLSWWTTPRALVSNVISCGRQALVRVGKVVVDCCTLVFGASIRSTGRVQQAGFR